MEIFVELSSIVVLAAVVAFIMRLLKQPLIVGYILTGIIAGPYFLNIIHGHETMELFSKIGITILLFIVGLHMSPKVIKEVGKVSLLAGVGQIVLTSMIGFAIATFLGVERIGAMYIGIAITFSSTIIILKLLSDKGDLNKLYGKIAVGLLLVQDLIATLILIVSSTLANPGSGNLSVLLVWTLVKGLLLFNIMLVISAFVLPKLMKIIARSQEVLFLFSIAWGMGLAAVFHEMGFSVEIGALVAGVCLASTAYVHEISSRMRPLRDFFVVLFFILLGSQMILDNVAQIILPASILSLFVLIGNPIIVIILMNLLGYHKRTSFMAGITITQMSEFSLILATLAFRSNQLSQETLSLITLVGLITITISSYLIIHSHKLYSVLADFLSLLELRKGKKIKHSEEQEYEAILFGYRHSGKEFLKSFQKQELHYVVVDFDPEVIKSLQEQEIPARYGDAEDAEFLGELNLAKVKYVVSTIDAISTNEFLVHKVRQKNKKAIIIAVSHNPEEAQELYEKGASYVIMPHYLGTRYAIRMISEYGMEADKFDEAREKHLKYLEKRD